ncbi:transcriptional regulator [Veronia nyctiphanis]|uniref:Transcriptional regulator n=1 Tax=Veronia nyctiphanis TaxID=1278244 RepID=A0A4Q0YIY0_9GAMM|nr:helix-turn-helix transcriptional regulator [Veronia nyctiphanis]RXJ70667.1 transcriptional regulator [Veronia nyctiphanis]
MSDKLVSYSSVLGVVIANKRKEKGLEQSAVAEKLGLSQGSYSRLESGKATFSVDQMFDCAAALEIDSLELIKSLVSTIENLRVDESVTVKSQPRGNASKAKSESSGSGVGAFVAGAALTALIFGLASKSK